MLSSFCIPAKICIKKANPKIIAAVPKSGCLYTKALMPKIIAIGKFHKVTLTFLSINGPKYVATIINTVSLANSDG